MIVVLSVVTIGVVSFILFKIHTGLGANNHNKELGKPSGGRVAQIDKSYFEYRRDVK